MTTKWIIVSVISALLVYGFVYYYLPSNKAALSPSALPVTDHTVTYTDAGFSPNVLATTKGATIVFINASSKDIRIASNPHPLHDEYPTMGGCISSIFDSCTNIAPGQSWSFTFVDTGTWGYHNHLNPGNLGTIIVK